MATLMSWLRSQSGAGWYDSDPSEAPTPEKTNFDGKLLFATAWENALDRDLLKLLVAEAMARLDEAAAKGDFRAEVTVPRRVNMRVYLKELENVFAPRSVKVKMGFNSSSDLMSTFTFVLTDGSTDDNNKNMGDAF